MLLSSFVALGLCHLNYFVVVKLRTGTGKQSGAYKAQQFVNARALEVGFAPPPGARGPRVITEDDPGHDFLSLSSCEDSSACSALSGH